MEIAYTKKAYQLLLALFILLFVQEAFAQPKWIRATYRDDPSTTIALGWSGIVGTVYYDTTDHGTNYAAYALTKTVDRSTSHKGNNHYFVRLTNLQPGTVYYFVIQHGSSSVSARYSFRTISDDPNQPISFISGGDSRQRVNIFGVGDPACWGNGCRETRQDLNRIVGKIRPDFVAFTGDYIRNYDVFPFDSDDDWEEWMNDWDLANGPDGRITPIIHALGNHEDAVDLDRLFDVSNTDIYYATNFGGNLFRLYTLNSEPSDACTDVIQKNWLVNDLQQNSMPSNTPYWKIVQYHQPMVPHANYSARTDLINCWASEFATYGVRLTCESHTHVLKTTYPLKYDATASSSYHNLVRDDSIGAVFLGDGSWGAPPRTAYAPIPNVTQDVEQISGFFFVNINKQRIQIKTVVPFPDSMANVPQLLDDDQGTLLPTGVPLWRPANGSECIIIPNYNPLLLATNKVLDVPRAPAAVVAPNPAQDYVTVRFKEVLTEAVTIEIYDARGKRCQSHTNVKDQNFKVDVSNLCSGVNFINIVTDKDVESHKVVIVK